MQIFHLQAGSVMTSLDEVARLPSKGCIWIDCISTEVDEALLEIKRLLSIDLDIKHQKLLYDFDRRGFLFDLMESYEFLRIDTVVPIKQAASHSLYAYESISAVICDRVLLTVHSKDLLAIHDAQKYLFSPNAHTPESARLLLIYLMHEVIEDFYMIHEPLRHQYSEWQQKILDTDSRFSDWDHILIYKDQLRQLRTVLESCQGIFRRWWQTVGVDVSATAEEQTHQLHVLNEHVQDQMQIVLNMENDLATLLNLHFSISSNRTNDVMRILTIIAGTFLPLNLITGVFGMNFHHMAGLQSQYGYYYTLSGMVLLVVGIIWYCRWRRLF